jgi:hypothetical protein
VSSEDLTTSQVGCQTSNLGNTFLIIAVVDWNSYLDGSRMLVQSPTALKADKCVALSRTVGMVGNDGMIRDGKESR